MMRSGLRAESFTGYGGMKLVEVPRPRARTGGCLSGSHSGVNPRWNHTILVGRVPTSNGARLILGNEGAGVVEDSCVLGALRRRPGSCHRLR